MLAFLLNSSRPAVIRSTSTLVIARTQPSRPMLALSSSRWFSTNASATENTQQQQQQTTSSTAQSETSTDSMNVPKTMVKYLIGLRGRNLASLSERSGGAKVVFTSEETPQGEEVAQIQGDAGQIAKMKQAIKEDLEKFQARPAQPEKSGSGRTTASGSSAADYIEEVIVDSQYVGVLIGKQGAVLKEMEASSGAKIQYSNRDDTNQERSARIRGTKDQVEAAKKLIADRIYSTAGERSQRFDNRRPPRPQGDARKSREPSPNDIKQVVEVPSDFVGPLIGKGGKSLFQMQDQTGAKFEFAKEDHREGAREVNIFGNTDQVRAAVDLIQKRVRQVQERNEAGSQ